MKLNKLVGSVQKGFSKHSNHIWCAGIIFGLGASIYCAVKDTKKYEKRIEHTMTKKEKAVVLAKSYLPTAVSTAATVTCAIALDITDAKKLKEVTMAYAALKETTSFVTKNAGDFMKEVEKKNPELTHEVRKEVNKSPSGLPSPIKRYCLSWRGHEEWFEATPEAVVTAELNLNYKIQRDGYASVNDLVSLYGCKSLKDDNNFGWSKEGPDYGESGWCNVIKLEFIDAERKPYTKLTFFDKPYIGYSNMEWYDGPSDEEMREFPEIPADITNDLPFN